MRRSLLLLSVLSLLVVLGACASEPATTPEPAATDKAAAPDASADPLTGTVNPGPNAVALTKASFNKDTGMVAMEADAKGHGGETVHYTIEGKVDGTTMTGSWNHGDKKGDFKLMKG